MRKLAVALVGCALWAGTASAQVGDMGDFSKLTDLVSEQCPPFSAQMSLDGQTMGPDRVMNIYYVPGKIRIEGTRSKTAYIALTREQMYYVNFEGNSWVKMPMSANASPHKTGIEELDQELFSEQPARYTTRRLGTKVIDGKSCLVTEVKNETDGRTMTTYEWKEKHAPLLIVSKDRNGHHARVSFSNYRWSTPASSLFAPPRGAKIMSVQDLTKGLGGDLKGLDSLKGFGND